MDLVTISGAIALGVYIHARRWRPLLLLHGVPLYTSLDQWEYLGEGGAHVLLQYCGPAHPLLSFKVLRLRKSKSFEGGSSLDPSREMLAAALANSGTSSGPPPPLVDLGVPVALTDVFVTSIYNYIQCLPHRPLNRHGSNLDRSHRGGHLLSNYLLLPPLLQPSLSLDGPTSDTTGTTASASASVSGSGSELARKEREAVPVCIELKPKWGDLPVATNIHPVKRQVCRYCMLQEVRGLQSRYCPIDLFSGDQLRIVAALRHLLQCPSNNMKLFISGEHTWPQSQRTDKTVMSGIGTEGPEGKDVRGQGCHPQENSMRDLFNISLTAPLTSSLPFVQHHTTVEEIVLSSLASILFTTRVLEKLLALQRLDTLDIENLWTLVAPAWSRYSDEASGDCDGVLSVLPASVRDAIHRFLIATSAKDCSIMITMKFIDERVECYSWGEKGETKDRVCGVVHGKEGGYTYSVLYSLAVVDLDVKTTRKLKKYFETDETLVRSYCLLKNPNGVPI